jgi:hypothetical protein
MSGLIVTAIFWSYVLVAFLAYKAGQQTKTTKMTVNLPSKPDDGETPRAWRKTTYVDGPTD